MTNPNPDQIYTTYIRTSAEKLWAALTNPEFTRQYWFSCENKSDWKQGSKWQHYRKDDNSLLVEGKVLESTPPTHLVLTWHNPETPKDASRVSFTIEQAAEEGTVKLTVIHGDFKDNAKMANAVGNGWPLVLSSLKSYLETGKGFSVKAGTCAKPDAA